MTATSRVKYSELVDITKLQELMESLNQAIGVSNAVIDVNGTIIARAGWQDACANFHRVNAESCRRCVESDTTLVESMTRGAPYAIYHCHNGLVDSAAPIIVEDEHVANVFTGQFLTEPPDLDFFRQQARQFGFDETGYLEAISRLPVLSQERVESVTRLYAQLAGMLADNGLDRLKQRKAVEDLARLNTVLEDKVAARTQALARANEDLAGRESLIKQIFDTSSVAIFLVDENGLITQANKRMAEMFCWPLEKLVGSEYTALVHPSEREAGRQNMRALLASSTPSVDLDRLYCRADHSEFWGHLTGKRFHDASGKELGLVGVIADITDHKKAKLALLESENRFRRISSITSDLVYSCKRSDDGRYQVDWMGGNGQRVFGYDTNELKARGCWQCFVVAEDQAIFTRNITDLQPGQSSDVILRATHRDGSLLYLRSVAQVEDDPAGHNHHRLYGALQDVTMSKSSEAAIAESRNLLQAIIDTAPVRVFWKDQNLRYMGCNPAFARDAGKTLPRDVIGKDDFQMAWADQAELYRTDDRQVMKSGIAKLFYEEPQTTPTGQKIWLRTSKVPLTNHGDETIGLLGIYDDITERKLAEQALQESQSKLRGLFELSPLGIALTDMDGRYIEFNEAFRAISGYPADELREIDYWTLTPPEYMEQESAQLESLRNTGRYGPYEKTYRQKNGHLIPIRLNGILIQDQAGQPHIWSLVEDITAQKEHQQQLEHIAHYDALTTLPNRVLLADRLHQAMIQAQRRGQRLAVAYLDLDGFKIINDRHGHEAGDQLLIALASRMKQALREGDTLARLGGDEFVAVLLDLANIEASVPMLTRLLVAAAQPVHVGELVLQVSASLGVTFYPQEKDVDADQLLRQADQAMYQAKLAGKNRYHVFDAKQERSTHDLHQSPKP